MTDTRGFDGISLSGIDDESRTDTNPPRARRRNTPNYHFVAPLAVLVAIVVTVIAEAHHVFNVQGIALALGAAICLAVLVVLAQAKTTFTTYVGYIVVGAVAYIVYLSRHHLDSHVFYAALTYCVLALVVYLSGHRGSRRRGR